MPILTNPTGVATGQTTALGAVTTDTAGGTIYAVVTQSPTAPTGAQVKAGLNELGAPADYFEISPLIIFPGAVSFSAVGLAPATTYFFHFVHETNKLSAVVSSPSFITLSPDVTDARSRDRMRNSVVRGVL